MSDYMSTLRSIKEKYANGDTEFFEEYLIDDGADEEVLEEFSDSLSYMRALMLGRVFNDWFRKEESLDLKNFQSNKFKACVDDNEFLYVVYEDKVIRYSLYEFDLGVHKAEVEGVVDSFVIIGLHFTNVFFLSKIRMLYDTETNYFSLLGSSSNWDSSDGMIYEASRGKQFTSKDATDLKRKLVFD